MQKVLIGNVEAAVQHELVGVHDTTFSHHEDVNARDGLLAVETDDIGIEVARRHGVLLVGQRVDGVDARLDASRALEVEVLGGPPHLRRELVDDFAMMP